MYKSITILQKQIRILAVLALVAYSANVLCNNPEKQFSKAVSITDCFFNTYEDCNDDGFASKRWLVVDMSGTAAGSVYIQVQAYYAEVDEIIAVSPTFTTPRARYSFWVEGTGHFTGNIDVHVRNAGDDSLEDTYHISGTVDFESAENDLDVTLDHLSWSTSEYTDNDGDGYYSAHQMNFNFNSCPIATDIYYEISACKHPIYAGSCPYHTSADFTLGAPGEPLNVVVGGATGDLDSGLYQIGVFAYDAVSDGVVVGWTQLSFDKKFESAAEDATPAVTFAFDNIYLDTTQIDLDGDSYSRARDLHFLSSVSSGTYDVKAKVLWKLSSASTFNSYSETEMFTISSSTTTWQTVTLGFPTDKLDSNIYDFKLELYLGTALVAEADQTDDSDLATQWFETPVQDAAIYIDNASWSNLRDYDGDGTPSIGNLDVTLSSIDDPSDVHLELWSYWGEVSSRPLITDPFELTSAGRDTSFKVQHEHYFQSGSLVLYREPEGNYEDSWSIGSDQNFEGKYDDVGCLIEWNTWSDTIDNDGDGFYSHATLTINVDAQPYSDTGIVKLSLCKWPIYADPCWYFISNQFVIDSAGRADSCVIEIGLPNDELTHGYYQVAYTFNDSLTDELLVGFQYLDDSMKFEPVAEDQVSSLNQLTKAVTQIEVYPNPAQSELYIATIGLDDAYTIKIYSAIGNLVYQEHFSNEGLAKQEQGITITSLPVGWYVISVQTEQARYFNKLLISR